MTALRTAALLIALSISGAPIFASAATIGFDPLAGPNGTAYAGHTEDGFDVSATSGTWQQAFFVGNPVPSVFTFSDSASLMLSASGGGLFTFESIDLGTGSTATGSYQYLITGFNSGSDVLSIAGTFLGNTSTFLTVLSTDTSVALDALTIALSDTPGAGITSFNVDNIVLGEAGEPIPEPTAAICFAAGLLAVASRTRRR